MYYMIKTAKEEKLIDVPGINEAVRALSGAVQNRSAAALYEDGKEIMHGHIYGSKIVLNWRD